LYDAKLQVLEDTRKAINRRPRLEAESSLLDISFVNRIASGSQTLKGRREIKSKLEATALPLYEVESEVDLVDTARKHRYSEDLTESFETFGGAKKEPEDTRIKQTEHRSPYESMCKDREHFENTYLSPVRQSCESVLRDDDKENVFKRQDTTKTRLEALELEVQRLKEQSAAERGLKDQALKEKECEISFLKEKFQEEKLELCRLKSLCHSRSHSRSPLVKKRAPSDLELRLQELRYKNELLTQELVAARQDCSQDQVYSSLVVENARLKTQNSELEAQLKGKAQLVCSKCRAFLLANGELTFKLNKLKALVDG
jgi:hypothetical protein